MRHLQKVIEGIINSETPKEHWAHIDCRGKIILDLGCGFWTQQERNSGDGTAKYFLGQKPKQYIGVDSNSGDIARLSLEFPSGIFIEKHISIKDDILSLLSQFSPEIIKCDIEGAECTLFEITSLESLKEVAVETHGGTDIFCIEWMKKVGLNHWRTDLASFCPDIKIIYAKC